MEVRSGMTGRAGGQAGEAQVSPIRIQEYLAGIEYPATKDQLISHAREHEAPEAVIAFMERLPKRNYRSATEVSQEAGKIA